MPQFREIKLSSSGLIAIVDESDFEWISQWRWYPVQPPTCRTPYAMRTEGPKSNRYTIRMHRLLLGLGKGDASMVDHVNGNGLDNRRSNLRICTRAENAAHSIREGREGLKGVYLDKRRGKWRAQITVGRKYIHLGMADSPEEAFEFYKEAARKYFGEFATFEKRLDALQKQK